jgi:hypothetical protein
MVSQPALSWKRYRYSDYAYTPDCQYAGVASTDAHAEFTPDGGAEDINATAGTVQRMDAFTHLPESTSKTPFEVIAVELKS